MDNKSRMEEDISRCLAVLQQGGTILYPTDTVWGIGCDALQPAAVDRVFELKQRPAGKTMILLLADMDVLEQYVTELPDAVRSFILSQEEPTTVIFPAARNLPDNVISGDGSIAVRITRDPFCVALIRQLGRPLVSTSANTSGQPAAAVFAAVEPLIRETVDYAVQYRRDDGHIAPPSRIFRFDAEGQPLRLR